jgi:hypothetical protein
LNVPYNGLTKNIASRGEREQKKHRSYQQENRLHVPQWGLGSRCHHGDNCSHQRRIVMEEVVAYPALLLHMIIVCCRNNKKKANN